MSQRFKPASPSPPVIEWDGRYPIVEEDTPEGLRLNNPAGHLEQGESPLEARGARGAGDCTALCTHRLPGRLPGPLPAPRDAGRRDLYVRLAYSGTLGGPLPPAQSWMPASGARWWLSLDELAACQPCTAAPGAAMRARDHAAGQRLPLDAVFSHGSLSQLPTLMS